MDIQSQQLKSNSMKILVTGGSGMVGRELKKYLPDAYYPNRCMKISLIMLFI